MKVTSVVLPLFVASLASSSSFFGSGSQDALVDDKLSVPGENPLTVSARMGSPSEEVLTVLVLRRPKRLCPDD